MKDFIKTKLRQRLTENLNEAVEGGEYPAYHGSDTQITQFTDKFAGAVGAADADGPGIYFTNSYQNGIMWGAYIHKVVLRPRKMISNETPAENADREDLKKFLDMIPDDDYANNRSEDIEEDKMMTIEDAIQYSETEDDVWLSLRADQFNGSPQGYMRLMSSLGYDMLYLNKNDLHGLKDVETPFHYVVYNPEIITVVGIEPVNKK